MAIRRVGFSSPVLGEVNKIVSLSRYKVSKLNFVELFLEGVLWHLF